MTDKAAPKTKRLPKDKVKPGPKLVAEYRSVMGSVMGSVTGSSVSEPPTRR